MSAAPQLIVSTPPHLKAPENITSIMRMVCIALIPAFVWSFYIFGWYAIAVTVLCVLSCVVSEAVCQRLRGVKVTIGDSSAALTGLLLAAVIPPNVTWWIPVVGGIFAIGLAKHCFGGLGHNIWNPALLSRAFLQNSFPSEINSGQWSSLSTGGGVSDILENVTTSMNGTFTELAGRGPDVVTSASSLATIQVPTLEKGAAVIQQDWSMVMRSLIGAEGGCIGEVSAIALLIGGLLLLFKKIIHWEIPLCYIATVVLLGWVLPAPYKVAGSEETLLTAWFQGPWALHLVGGGLFIGAFFMATDYVTSPMSKAGRVAFGLGCGLLTIVIRLYAGYPEGVCYAILIMNTCVPIIDAWSQPKKFGLVTEES